MSTQWTFLIYLAADNALYEDAQISLRQITDASRFTDIRILVHFDGPTAARSSRYACALGSRKLVWEAAAGYTTNRADRLADFLNFAIDQGYTGTAPSASRIFLVLWGHGAGLDHVYLYSDPKPPQPAPSPALPAPSQTTPATLPRLHTLDLLNSDDAHANRYIGNIQLSSILSAFSSRLGSKIDILGFDACLMCMAEICHELAPSVSLLIASDEEIPLQSWPYNTLLGDLARFPAMDPAALSAVTVSRFIDAYASPRNRISLTALDLSACQTLTAAIKSLVQELSASAADPIRRATILHARDFSRTPDVHDYIDLAVFCQEIACSFPDDSPLPLAATTLFAQLTRLPLILYHRDAGENGAINPFGLAIYFPQSLPPTSAQLHSAASSSSGLQLYFPLVPPPGNSPNPPSADDPFLHSLGNSVSKTVGDGTKTVGDGTKTVGDGTKHLSGRGKRDLAGGRRLQRELIGSEILWDSYIRLQFNADTGWAALLVQLLSDPASTHPPANRFPGPAPLAGSTARTP